MFNALDVQYASGLSEATAGTIAPAGADFVFWSNGYANLPSAAYGRPANAMHQIFFRKLSGSQLLRLNSFKLGAFSAGRTCSIRIVERGVSGAERLLWQRLNVPISEAEATLFTGPWETRAGGLALQLGSDLLNTAVSEIDLTIDAPPPPPTTAPVGVASHLLDFSNACDGPCENYDYISQSYGDAEGLNVIYSAGLPLNASGTVVATEGVSFQYWSSGYGSLAGAAFGPNQGSISQIFLSGRVRLESFDIGVYTDSSVTVTVRVLAAETGAILFESVDFPLSNSATHTFAGSWGFANGIILQLGPDIYLSAVDNIRFSVDEAYVESTADPVTADPAVVVDGLLDWVNACNGGQSCANDDKIDQR